MRGLTAEDTRNIVDSYQNLVRMKDLATRYNLTRQRIWQVLKAAGVDTAKKGGIDVACAWCDKEFKKPRCQVRQRKRCFCSNDCYYAWLAKRSAGFEPWRHGMRIARSLVSEYFILESGYVVHHEDGNNQNNDLSNLRVFESHGDHLRYHRGFGTKPLWDGSTLHNKHRT